MAGQICKTCLYKTDCSCYCSPNSTCEYYEKDKIDFENTAIKASNMAGLTNQCIFDAENKNGLMGVYDLGMKHMYEYLKFVEVAKMKKN